MEPIVEISNTLDKTICLALTVFIKCFPILLVIKYTKEPWFWKSLYASCYDTNWQNSFYLFHNEAFCYNAEDVSMLLLCYILFYCQLILFVAFCFKWRFVRCIFVFLSRQKCDNSRSEKLSGTLIPSGKPIFLFFVSVTKE